jgi:hypothetical protein
VRIIDIFNFHPIELHFLEIFIERSDESCRIAQNIQKVKHINIGERFDFFQKHNLDNFESLLVLDLSEEIFMF